MIGSRWLAPGLHAIALIIAFFAQSSGSPFAGAWIFFNAAGCAVLLYSNEPTPRRGVLWWATLGWLVALTVHTFLIRPVVNGGSNTAVLMAGPMLALCMKKDTLPYYIKAFLGVAFAYILGMYLQLAMDVEYAPYNYVMWYGRTAPVWPIIDPNNAACVLNIALPAFLYAAFYNWRLSFLPALTAGAIILTGSQAGCVTAALTSTAMIIYYLRPSKDLIGLTACAMIVAVWPFLEHFSQKWGHSLDARLPMWESSLHLLNISPLFGVGSGQFSVYYKFVRTEFTTGGFFAHNDLLQFAIEFGIPVALIFVCFFATALWKSPMVARCCFFAALLQSMSEFQFYVPVVALASGLPIAYTLFMESSDKK